MNATKEILVLKFSSDLIAQQTSNGLYEIDYKNIEQHGSQISALLDHQNDLSLIIVSSAAHKMLGRDAWTEVLCTWRSTLNRDVKGILMSEKNFHVSSLEAISHTASGGIAILNGNDALLSEDSRWRNNDFVSSDFIGVAATFGAFGAIELGMFTNVPGLLKDAGDKSSVLPVVYDIQSARSFVTECSSTSTTGGMATKLDAADIALRHGARKVWVAHGRSDCVLEQARNGLSGTTFLPPV